MSFPATISSSAIEFVLGMLLPGLGGEVAAARALAIDLLQEHGPQTARELRLAGEAIGHSLKGLAMLAQSSEPGIAPVKVENSLKWATRLARSGQQAQAKLDALQRAPSSVRFSEAALQDHEAPEVVAVEPPLPPVAAPTPADPPVTELAEAEAKLHSAEKLLSLMKAHHKGAPPPHSKAAQDIKAQQRVVDTACMTLAQARRAVGLPLAAQAA